MAHPDPAALAKVPLFAGLTTAEYQKIASWLDVEEFAPGHFPVRNHASGYAFFILDDGRAHAEMDGKVLEVLEPGAVFGEMAFFARNGRRSADIVPETPIRVLTMFGTRFREMQQDMPEVAARLEQLVHQRQARDAGVQAETQQP